MEARGGGAAHGQVLLAHGGRNPGMSLVDARTTARRAVDLARRAGADDAEAYVENVRALSVRVNMGTVETVKHSTLHGLGLRVIVDHKVGFVSTNDLRDET